MNLVRVPTQMNSLYHPQLNVAGLTEASYKAPRSHATVAGRVTPVCMRKPLNSLYHLPLWAGHIRSWI